MAVMSLVAVVVSRTNKNKIIKNGLSVFERRKFATK